MNKQMNPTEVIVLNRQREDLGDIVELAESIARLGQLQPILLNDRNELIAGMRRLSACIHLKIDVKVVYQDAVDPATELEMEIEENIRRKNFTVDEEVRAKKKLHDMKMSTEKDWNLRKTAAVLGVSLGSVSMDIEVAKQMEETPEAFNKVSKKRDAYDVVRKKKEDAIIAEINKRAESKSDDFSKNATKIMFKGDCTTMLTSIPDSSFDICISDPPFGIDINKKKRSESTTIDVYADTVDDSVDGYRTMISAVVKELSRIIIHDGWIIMFCDMAHYYWLHGELKAAGFNPDIVPMIWYKTNTAGQTRQPHVRPGRVYESIITAYRGDAAIYKQGKSNVLPFDTIAPTLKTHPLERPLPLLKELIERYCMKGNKLIDPFAGSASMLIAALAMGVLPVGIEIEEAKYNQAIKNISDYFVKRDVGQGGI